MGIANTTILTYDSLSGQYTQRQDFQNYTEVNIQAPFVGQRDYLTGATFQENNPFNLIVSSTPDGGFSPANGTLSPPGGINLFSSAETASGFFAQYWDIDIVNNEGGIIEFEGVLQQEYRGEALAINQINTSSGAAHSVTSVPGINFGEPEVIYRGATIRGYFSSDESEFGATVQGHTLDGDYFEVQIIDDFV